jgi:hypothetical protein
MKKVLLIVFGGCLFFSFHPKKTTSFTVYYLSCFSTTDRVWKRGDVVNSMLSNKVQVKDKQIAASFEAELDKIIKSNAKTFDSEIDARIVIDFFVKIKWSKKSF